MEAAAAAAAAAAAERPASCGACATRPRRAWPGIHTAGGGRCRGRRRTYSMTSATGTRPLGCHVRCWTRCAGTVPSRCGYFHVALHNNLLSVPLGWGFAWNAGYDALGMVRLGTRLHLGACRASWYTAVLVLTLVDVRLRTLCFVGCGVMLDAGCGVVEWPPAR